MLFLKISVFDEFGGPFLKGQKGPKGQKFTLLIIEILEYLHPERSPAARRCACFISYLYYVTLSEISYNKNAFYEIYYVFMCSTGWSM